MAGGTLTRMGKLRREGRAGVLNLAWVSNEGVSRELTTHLRPFY